MTRWITADWHLGEDRMQIMQRPFVNTVEMIDTLRERHNALVSKDDEVYVVGDAVYQKVPHYLSIISRFNGKKILIRGNHDRVFTDEQLKPYFVDVIDEGEGIYLDVGGIPCYLTHYPSTARKDAFNLVGHIHGAWKYQLNMLNVGVDANHFTPHNLDEAVPFYYKAVSEFYDDDVWSAYQEVNSQYVAIRGKKGVYFTPKEINE